MRREDRSNRSSTVLSLGSVAEPLTATAVLVPVEQRRTGLTEKLGDLLSGVPEDKGQP